MTNKYFSPKKCSNCGRNDWHFVMSFDCNPVGNPDQHHLIQCTHCHLVFEEEEL